MCQPNGDCVVNFVPPNCNGVFVRGFEASAVSCPLVNCAPPICPVDQQETPKNERGCSLCPRCRPGLLPPSVLGAPSPGVDIWRKQGDTGTPIPARPCPLPRCGPANCPESQQEIFQNARGCPMCPVCKVSSASSVYGASPTNAETFQRIGGQREATPPAHCPRPACISPNCPESQQETSQNDQGCPMCPRCKVSEEVAASESLDPQLLVHCPADETPCPDGTWVGRKPPHCAFDPCPSGFPGVGR